MWLFGDDFIHVCMCLCTFVDSTTLSVLICKEKIQWHFLLLVKANASVLDITLHIEVGVFMTILLQQFTISPVGEARDVKKIYGLVTVPKEKLEFRIRLINC